jgi:hypothetical protein
MHRLCVLACSLATLAACDVGDVPSGGGNLNCAQAATPSDGHHNSGMTCNSAGCHGDSAGLDKFAVTGTVYETATGAAKPGATVIITWPGGEARYVTGGPAATQAGNFYDYAAPSTIVYPATVRVSLCPDEDKAMVGPLTSEADLDCSKSGCHASDRKIFLK